MQSSWAKTRPNAKTIAEWAAYEKFIEDQLTDIGNDNVKGLECGMNGNKLNYRKSPFNNFLSDGIKMLYEDHVKAEVADIPRLPFFTSVFTDTSAEFLPYALKIRGNETTYLMNIDYKSEDTKMVDIFSGEYDKDYDNFLESQNPKNIAYLEKLTPSFLALIAAADERPVLSICFWSVPPFLFHAIALICFKKDGKYNFFVYDPMYYKRPDKKKGQKEYDDALICAYINYYLLAKMHNIPFHMDNLSQLCPSTVKGKHCVQYIMNGEYCSMFSLYFLYLYAKAGCPTNLSEIQPIVDATFMSSDPGKMNRKVCAETNKFKIKITSFMLSVLALFSQDNPPVMNIIKSLASDLRALNGISYLHPDLESLEGGRLRLRDTRAKTSRKRMVGRRRRSFKR
jgi:hypothetical protein